MRIFINRYGEFRSGWSLALSAASVLLIQVLLSLVLSVISVYQVGLEDTVVNDEGTYSQTIMSLTEAFWFQCLLYALMIAALFLLFRIIYKRPIKQLGLYADGWGIQLLFGGAFGMIAIAMALLLLIVTGAAVVTEFDAVKLMNGLFWAGFVKYCFVGFFEEILSRGYMMTVLKTTRNQWVIIFTPAILFGLLHIMNDHVTAFSLANIALVGVLFGYLFIKTGRLWAPIGFHITWNFFQGNVFGIPVSGMDNFSAMKTLFTGSEWLTGGAFGIEGGAACTLVILLGLAYIRFFVKKPKQPAQFWQIESEMPLTRGTRPARPAIGNGE